MTEYVAGISRQEMAVTQELGLPLPLGDFHSVSVSLPLWEHVVGYEEGDSAIVQRMTCGYPRFRYHDAVLGVFAVVKALWQLRQQGSSSGVAVLLTTDKFLPVDYPREGVLSLDAVSSSVGCLVLPSLAAARRFKTFMVSPSSSSFPFSRSRLFTD